ncbi:MAG: CPBP family intramembrane metalloprotease [Acidobacteria bacterium]|nr:CPBP family intramembrane metalloprotease [Acidobacteriota bacterium]
MTDRTPTRPGGRWEWVPPVLAVGLLAGWGWTVLRRVPAGRGDRVLTLLGFVLLVLPALLFTTDRFRELLRSRRRPLQEIWFPAWLLFAHAVYLAGPGRLAGAWSLLLLAYLWVPVGCAVMARSSRLPGPWDWIALLSLYLPVELALLAPAWEPAGAGLPSPAHTLAQLTGVNLALFCFLCVRDLPEIGYRFHLSGGDLLRGAAAFALFFPVAVGFGARTGLVPFAPHWPDPGRIPGEVLGVTFLVALPEELFFRGILQNLLVRIRPTPGGRTAGLVGASVLFGLSHLNNHPRFDWRYVVIATLAGLVYGWVYRATGKVTASAVPHALVDIVWRLGF